MPRSIFITGAASGIGRATAALFASHEWQLGVADFDDEGLRRVAAELAPRKVLLADLDVTDYPAYERALAAFGAETGGRLDVLFNCAGILRQSALEALEPAGEPEILAGD